jgi:hypothetical protein
MSAVKLVFRSPLCVLVKAVPKLVSLQGPYILAKGVVRPDPHIENMRLPLNWQSQAPKSIDQLELSTTKTRAHLGPYVYPNMREHRARRGQG